MWHSRSVYLLILLLVFTTSCTLSSTPTAPILSPTAILPTLPEPTEIPTLEPTASPSATPAEISTQPPINPDLYLPDGIVTFQSTSGKVSYYDLEGQLLGDVQPSGFRIDLHDKAILAGAFSPSPNPQLPPLIYYSADNNGEIWLNNNNNPSLLVAAPNLHSLVGVPGKSIMAYTLMEFLDFGLRSKLYLGDPQSAPSLQPILDNTNTESYAIKPIAITMTSDQPSGVWYTTVPYGIGGEIVFEPRRALNYFDLGNDQINSYLNNDSAPVGISSDQIWIAYTPAGGVGPLSVVHNFDFQNVVSFPLRPDSDRGSGDAVFSPDDSHIAWKEASGSLSADPPNFYETIRIGAVDGSLTAEIVDTSFTTASGFQEISWIIPIGWADTQTVVVEVRSTDPNMVCLLTVNLDGSQVNYLVPGSFIGFLYP